MVAKTEDFMLSRRVWKRMGVGLVRLARNLAAWGMVTVQRISIYLSLK